MPRACNSCEILYINGLKCHEHGCPDAWKDYSRECNWCGSQFKPEGESQDCCSHSCFVAYNNMSCEECTGIEEVP